MRFQYMRKSVTKILLISQLLFVKFAFILAMLRPKIKFGDCNITLYEIHTTFYSYHYLRYNNDNILTLYKSIILSGWGEKFIDQ